MPMVVAYWVLMLLLLVFGVLYVWPHGAFLFSGNFVIVYMLLLIIGWRLFGKPVQ